MNFAPRTLIAVIYTTLATVTSCFDASAQGRTLVVEPASAQGFRTISEAVQKASDSDRIEVYNNDKVRTEIRLPAHSVSIVSSKDFEPIIANTIKVRGGKLVRFERLHFKPYSPTKPAIEILEMPDRFEIVQCTFQTEGTVIRSRANVKDEAGTLVLENCLGTAASVVSLHKPVPRFETINSVFVTRDHFIDWDRSMMTHPMTLSISGSTIVSPLVFRSKAVESVPPDKVQATRIQLNSSLFHFPEGSPGSLMHWDMITEQKITKGSVEWSGSNVVLSGKGEWNMLRRQVKDSPVTVMLANPAVWLKVWATSVDSVSLFDADFVGGSLAFGQEITPQSVDFPATSAIRNAGKVGNRLGANPTKLIPIP